MPPYLQQSLSKLEEFEGSIPWMYRDTVGKVTVAVGRMLPDVNAARQLPFRVGGRLATPDEIAAEFSRVDALPMGRAAAFYRRPGGPELSPDDIAALLRSVLADFEASIRKRLPGYDALPDPVKLSLLDMSYNLGVAGLFNGFPRLIAAVEAGDWTRAAAVCERRGPGAARNAWTRQNFLGCVLPRVEARAENLLRQMGYGLLGLAATLFRRKRA